MRPNDTPCANAGDTPSRCNRAFADWSRIGREPASTAVIGILDGEGIGAELMSVCRHILEQVGACTGQQFEFVTGGLIGKPALAATGSYVTPEIEAFCHDIHARQGAVLCGPGGGRFVYDLRLQMNLFCKLVPLRPTQALRDIGPLRPKALDGVDMLVVRENLGGLYQGTGEHGQEDHGRRTRHCFEYDEPHVAQIVEVGARLAELRRGRLCVIHKPGGVPEVSELWQDVTARVTAGRELDVSLLEVDNACYQMIANASEFDVIVASNMFGDVLADGAAHDLAGTDQANPIGQIHSMIFMLREHFDLECIASGIEAGVEAVLVAGWRTADIMAPGCRLIGMREMGERIAQAACEQLTQQQA